jgi:hypothetical protein
MLGTFSPGCYAVSVKVKSALPTASGLRMTRHPETGAARERRVSARELVETRAAKEKIPLAGCRPATAG